MVAVPQSIEELFSAIQRRDLARWASNLLYQALGPVGEDVHLSRTSSVVSSAATDN